MFRRNRQQSEIEAVEHATCTDFKKIFMDDMDSLHLLALLLTADDDLAGQCFVAGLDESIRDNSVFRQWARSWSRRAIVKNAIQYIKPGQPEEETGGVFEAEAFEMNDAQKEKLVASVTQLAPLERFVFVMSVLEGYSPAECSTLLGCPVAAVVSARSQALRQIAGSSLPLDQNNEPICAGMIMQAGAA
jgi:DNA-directed RNA polymerase specialized sigma24 family protein